MSIAVPLYSHNEQHMYHSFCRIYFYKGLKTGFFIGTKLHLEGLCLWNRQTFSYQNVLSIEEVEPVESFR